VRRFHVAAEGRHDMLLRVDDTLQTNGSPTLRAAKTISMWMGLPSRIPVLALSCAINSAQWFAITVV
jgi:hypothetical protein